MAKSAAGGLGVLGIVAIKIGLGVFGATQSGSFKSLGSGDCVSAPAGSSGGQFSMKTVKCKPSTNPSKETLRITSRGFLMGAGAISCTNQLAIVDAENSSNMWCYEVVTS
jgi:hypothetical protein